MTHNGRTAEPLLKAPSAARFLLVALLPPILLVALFSWLTFQYESSETIRRQAARSFDRRIDQVSLLSRLKDAETAQRGYLLTGDPAFLAPYEPARREIRVRLAAAIATDDPEVDRAYLPSVSRLIDAKFAELDRTITLMRGGDPARARALVASGRGKRLMDRLRTKVGDMIQLEERRSRARRAAFAARLARMQLYLSSALVGLIVLLVASTYIAWRTRRQRYEALVEAVEAAQRQATILDSTIDAIVILNPSGTVETMNAAATRMLGYHPHDLERHDVATIIDLAPGDGSFHQRIGLADGNLRQTFIPDRIVRHRDGREIPVDVALGVMRLPSGDHVVASLRDISERRRLERVKDDLMSTVSHELRTPLTSIVGSLGLLRAGVAGALPGEASRLIEIAENNSRRLIRLINDMLDIDRIEAGKLLMDRQPIDLRAVIDDACLGSEGLARGGGVALACTAGDRPVMVSGDADRLLQVLSNLLSNAIRVAPETTEVELTLAEQAGRAVIAIGDRGPGIPAAFRDRIFGRFERAEGEVTAASPGTGLGLAISREIVLRHDGTIRFEDRASGGTRFIVELPLIGASVIRDEAAPRVLVCDGDEARLRELVAAVAVEGCAYDAARTVVEALAASSRTSYAAIIIGFDLPDGSALGFARTLRAANPPITTPIIAVAAHALGDGEAPSALDVVDRISKPVDPTRLAEALKLALTRSNARRPTVLHLDDDRDLLAVVSAALEPEARIVSTTDVAGARALLATVSPDAAILDIRLADGSGLDLIPFLIDADGVAIPTVIYSAQDVDPATVGNAAAILVKARGSIPDLKATIRRVVRSRVAAP